MPRGRLSMRKIGEVLRLKAAGMTRSDIARSTGIGRTTVYEYLSRAKIALLLEPDVGGLAGMASANASKNGML